MLAFNLKTSDRRLSLKLLKIKVIDVSTFPGSESESELVQSSSSESDRTWLVPPVQPVHSIFRIAVCRRLHVVLHVVAFIKLTEVWFWAFTAQACAAAAL